MFDVAFFGFAGCQAIGSGRTSTGGVSCFAGGFLKTRTINQRKRKEVIVSAAKMLYNVIWQCVKTLVPSEPQNSW
jgi:hypothetical protein